MNDTLYIAWRYIAYHKVKTAILVAAVTLIVYLPLALRTVVRTSERQLMSRAASTPLIVGAKGSALDLAIDTLYFESKPLERITMREADRVDRSGLAQAIPVYTRFRAGQHTIVGTTLDYFTLRNLEITQGRPIARLGECVLGAVAAERLGLRPGGRLASSPENPFYLAGAYPLEMHVTGVLRRTHTPDDLAVFVDLKTAWIIAGLGHGHEDLAAAADPDVLLPAEEGRLVANEKLLRYQEISDENIDRFHFHGDPATYPITAVIAVPHDKKSEDLLRGRYQSDSELCQIIRPVQTIAGLMATIFKVEGILRAVFLLISLAALLLIVLVMMLSIRLRRGEMRTMFKLGCSRTKIAGMLTAELALTAAMSVSLTIALMFITVRYVDPILRSLVL